MTSTRDQASPFVNYSVLDSTKDEVFASIDFGSTWEHTAIGTGRFSSKRLFRPDDNTPYNFGLSQTW